MTGAATRAVTVGLTPGEPAGIGPDLALALAGAGHAPPLVCYADPGLLAGRARSLGLTVSIAEADSPGGCGPPAPGLLRVVRVRAPAAVEPGRPDPRNAGYVLACLDAALDDCVGGRIAAMVTGPVQKSLLNDAGIRFSGHTEYLAERLGVELPVMLLVAERLRVALATTHVPLRAVADLVTAERLRTVLGIVRADLVRLFGLPEPRLSVCGLNPHAGEQGYLGDEDEAVLAPVIRTCRAEGWNVSGPVPADTAFTPQARASCDAIVAMYHDQGLTALKALGFGHAVNVTLGLPVVRTSVDHGTALELAGSGRADTGSLLAALRLAVELAGRARHAGR